MCPGLGTRKSWSFACPRSFYGAVEEPVHEVRAPDGRSAAPFCCCLLAGESYVCFMKSVMRGRAGHSARAGVFGMICAFWDTAQGKDL